MILYCLCSLYLSYVILYHVMYVCHVMSCKFYKFQIEIFFKLMIFENK